MLNKLQAKSLSDPKVAALERFIGESSVPLTLDRVGRFMLPQEIAEAAIHFRGTNYGIVEDLHQAVMHALAQYIRQSRMTSETISANVF